MNTHEQKNQNFEKPELPDGDLIRLNKVIFSKPELISDYLDGKTPEESFYILWNALVKLNVNCLPRKEQRPDGKPGTVFSITCTIKEQLMQNLVDEAWNKLQPKFTNMLSGVPEVTKTKIIPAIKAGFFAILESVREGKDAKP